jgi:hypothetical protein
MLSCRVVAVAPYGAARVDGMVHAARTRFGSRRSGSAVAVGRRWGGGALPEALRASSLTGVMRTRPSSRSHRLTALGTATIDVVEVGLPRDSYASPIDARCVLIPCRIHHRIHALLARTVPIGLSPRPPSSTGAV